MIQVSINEKVVLKVRQEQIFHRDDFICLNCHGIVERFYVFIRENKSEKIRAFGLEYPNIKNVSLDEILSIGGMMHSFEKYTYPETGYIEFRTEMSNEMITPSVIIFCGYVFYFGLTVGDYSRGPATKICLLGIKRLHRLG